MENITEIKYIIQEANGITNWYRTTKIRSLLSSGGATIPIIPVETLWEGLCEMFGEIIKIKDHLTKLNKNAYFFNIVILDKIVSIYQALEILLWMTKSMQEDFLPISKLKMYWEYAFVNLSTTGGDFIKFL